MTNPSGTRTPTGADSQFAAHEDRGAMLEKGPSEVSCPQGLSQPDFDNIRLVIDKAVKLHHPGERHMSGEAVSTCHVFGLVFH